MIYRIIIIGISVLVAALSFAQNAPSAAYDPLTGLTKAENICGNPQIGIWGDITTLLGDYGQNLYFRRGTGHWEQGPIHFNHAHALARLSNGHWLVADTDNHRLLEFLKLPDATPAIVRTELAGLKPRRPHDVIVSPDTGQAYVIDGNRRLFRFKSLDSAIEVWSFSPDELGYARSLSWFDGHLHVINSSRGEVLRIDDFDAHRFTTFRSPRPKAPRGMPGVGVAPSAGHFDPDGGALSTTGLILNDVDKAGNWYYGTNAFTEPYALGADTRPARLIRWRNWEAFERGEWEDLSAHIPERPEPLVPYYITIHQGTLYAPTAGRRLDRGQCAFIKLHLSKLPSK